MKKRRAERTYFNTEYMPQLEEDAIESNDPLEIVRMTHGTIDDVVKADEARFRRLCKQHGFNPMLLKKPKEPRP